MCACFWVGMKDCCGISWDAHEGLGGASRDAACDTRSDSTPVEARNHKVGISNRTVVCMTTMLVCCKPEIKQLFAGFWGGVKCTKGMSMRTSLTCQNPKLPGLVSVIRLGCVCLSDTPRPAEVDIPCPTENLLQHNHVENTQLEGG